MKKAIALFLGSAAMAMAAEFRVEEVTYSVGADLRVRQEIMTDIPLAGGGHNPNKNQMRFRPRLWLGAETEHWKLYLRVADEIRHYPTLHGAELRNANGYWPDQLVLDNLYLEGKGLLDGKLDFRAGRQDLMEKGHSVLGLDHLIIDGTPGDGSRSFFADMVRATWHFTDRSKLDGFALYNRSHNCLAWGTHNSWKRDLNMYVGDEDYDHDEWGGGAVFSSDLGESLPYKLFAIHKRDASFTMHGRTMPERHATTLGLHVEPQLNDEISFELESAMQLGDAGGALSARGWSAFAAVDWHPAVNEEFKPYANLSLEYLSGDKDNDLWDANDHTWDPLWNRSALPFEMFPYGSTTYLAYWSNQLYPKLTLGAKFLTKQSAFLSTGPIWADKQDGAGGGDGMYKGWLSRARWDFPLYSCSWFNLAGHLFAEHFLPGDYYDTSKPAWFLRWEFTIAF